MRKLPLIGMFFLGLMAGLLFNVNLTAEERIKPAEVSQASYASKIVEIDKKVDKILENQQMMFKELRKIFARIH